MDRIIYDDELQSGEKTNVSKKDVIMEVCKFIIAYAPGRTREELVKCLIEDPEVWTNQSHFSKRTIERRLSYIRKNFPNKYIVFDFKTGKYKIDRKEICIVQKEE